MRWLADNVLWQLTNDIKNALSWVCFTTVRFAVTASKMGKDLTPNEPKKSEQMGELEPAYDQMSTDYSGDYLARLISDDICH